MGNPRAIDFCLFRRNGEFGACLAVWVIEPEVTSLSSGKGGMSQGRRIRFLSGGGGAKDERISFSQLWVKMGACSAGEAFFQK